MFYKLRKFWWLLALLVLFSCTKKKPTNGGGPEPPILPKYFDHPAWNPQGLWIAAEHCDSIDTDEDGNLDQWSCGIWLVSSENGEIQLLVDSFGLPAWNPAGDKLAMVRGGQIFTIDVTSLDPAQINTSSLKQLTFEGGNFYPAWSPDGEWIAFDSNLDDTSGMYVIWIMKPDGSYRKDISIHGTGEWRMPSWTPDNEIVHIRCISPNPEIFVMDSTGDNSRRVTYMLEEAELNPKVSSKSIITFSLVPRKGYPTICTIHLDGTDFRQVTKGPDYRPVWSPDGKHIVFLHWNFSELIPGNGELWIINRDGSGLRQLTFCGGR